MKPKSETTVQTLANAITLATAAVHEIAGSEVGGTINGTPITIDALGQLIASRIQARYAKPSNKTVN